jgi:Ca-activated chloride channel family protein
MQLYSPWSLLLFLLVPLLAYWMMRKNRRAAVNFPSVDAVRSCPGSWRIRLRPVLITARLACIVLLIIALTRPRKGTVLSEVSTQGVAMEVLVDRSGSMQTEMDYDGQTLTRIDVVKKVLGEFVAGNDRKGLAGRGSDLIGLVTFARYADTVSPMVLSHNVMLEYLKKTQIVNIRSEDGTAIGDAIALGAARLKKCEEEILQQNRKLGLLAGGTDNSFKIKSKVILLLTDGCNNTGRYEPIAACELAKQWGIKIYTIGIGSAEGYTTVQTPMGPMRMPSQDDLDENLLKSLAEKTGGFYGRAGDGAALNEIIKKIDSLEKTQVKSVQYTQFAEKFAPWTIAAMCVLGFEMLGSCTVFRKIP